MIDEVIKGITDALYEEFGDAYETHKEASKQDMEEPAFFVRCVTPDFEKRLGNRRKADLLFIIQYFPQSKEIPKQEINDVYERLTICLELIEVNGKKVRGLVKCKDISSDVLTATAEYSLFLNQIEQTDCMESYDMKGDVIDGSSD